MNEWMDEWMSRDGIRTHRGKSDNLIEFGRTLYLQATTAGWNLAYVCVMFLIKLL